MREFKCSNCGQRVQGNASLCPACSAAAIAKPEDAEAAKVTPAAPDDGAIREGEPPVQQASPEPWPYKHEPGPGCGYGCLGNLVLGVLASAALFVLAVPVCQNVHNARIRTETMSNMKRIALACHDYHDLHKRLPSPTMVVIDNGKARVIPLSWRVAILPQLDQQALANDFDLTAAWDHLRNADLQDRMPTIFTNPFRGDEHSRRMTHFQYCTGQNTLFPDNAPRKLQDIGDGTSNTILFAEAEKPVIWTQPVDIAILPNQPLSFPQKQFLIALADGSVQFISRDMTDDLILRQLINPNDRKPDGDWDH